MNRSEAVRRVQDLIDWRRACITEGRCPRCEALIEVEGGRLILGELNVGWMEHEPDCPVSDPTWRDELLRLSGRFGIQIEDVPQPCDVYGMRTLLLGPRIIDD